MIHLPKELTPKTKLSIFKIKNVIYAITLLVPVLLVIQTFELHGGWIIACIFVSILTACMFLVDFPRYGNMAVVLKNSVIYMYIYKKKKNLVYNRTKLAYTKVIGKNGKEKTSKKLVDVLPAEMPEQIKEILALEDLKAYDDNIGYYIKHKGKKITVYLDLKINKLPRYFENNNQDGSNIDEFRRACSDFEGVLLAQNFGKLIAIEKDINLDTYTELVDRLELNFQDDNTENEKEAYIRMQRTKMQNANDFSMKKYYLEITDNDINTIINTINKIKSYRLFNDSNLLNEEDYDYLMHYLYYDNIDKTYGSTFIYNEKTKVYETYLTLERLGTEILEYYLLRLKNEGYDYSINYMNIDDPKAIINKAVNELSSNTGGSTTTQQERAITLNRIQHLSLEILDNTEKLFYMDVTVKITGYSPEDLKINLKAFLSSPNVKDIFYFNANYFNQKWGLRRFSQLGVSNLMNEYTYSYVIPSSGLSGGFPFNYLAFEQPYGLLKNVNNEGFTCIDTTAIDPKNGQLSFDAFIAGIKGSGKSTFMKETALDTIYLQGGSVIMFDFKDETEFMMHSFKGNSIAIGQCKINILDTEKLNKYDDNYLEAHIERVYTFFTLVYPDMKVEKNMLLFKEELRNFYELDINYELSINGFVEFLGENYKDVSKEDTTSEHKLLMLQRLINFQMSYPYFANLSDKNYHFANPLTALNFTKIKTNTTILSPALYWMIGECNTIIQNNIVKISKINLPTEDFINYINFYVEQNNIYDDELDAEIENLQIEDTTENREFIYELCNFNKKFRRIMIDEAHRAFELKETVNFILLMLRENRSSYAGVILATQKINDILKADADNVLNTVWDLTQYKILLQLGDNEIRQLVDRKLITNEEGEPLTSSIRGKGIIKIQGTTNIYDICSPITKEIDRLFDGGN